MSRRRRSAHASHERWLVSYADFITLLFAFFVVLYSSAQVDKRKVGMLAEAIQVAFEQMGAFDASNSKPAMVNTEPMPFSQVQIVESAKRNESLARVANSPSGQLNEPETKPDMRSLQA